MNDKIKESSETISSKISYFVNHASIEEKKKIYDRVMSESTKMQNEILAKAKQIA